MKRAQHLQPCMKGAPHRVSLQETELCLPPAKVRAVDKHTLCQLPLKAVGKGVFADCQYFLSCRPCPTVGKDVFCRLSASWQRKAGGKGGWGQTTPIAVLFATCHAVRQSAKTPFFYFFKCEFRFWTFDIVTCSKLGQSFFIASTCNKSEP